jgi:hypothetical protein
MESIQIDQEKMKFFCAKINPLLNISKSAKVELL